MMTRHLPVGIAVAILVGCVQPVAPLPPAPHGLHRISVQQPANRTGGDLLLEDPGWIGRLIEQKRSSVPDLLAVDLRSILATRGFDVVAGASASAPALRIEIGRWQPYSADYSMVTVDVTASLVEPESGRAVWSAERATWNVATPDARSRHEASREASRAIAEALLAGWQPGESAPPSKSR